MNDLDDILNFETNKRLYQFSFSYENILIYPFVRYFLLQSAIEDLRNIPSPYSQLNIGTIQKTIFFFKSFYYRPHKAKQSDIIFFGSDISNVKQGNAYFNRLTETFANEYPSQTILIESADKMNYKRPRTFSKVYARDFINISAKIRSYTKRIRPEDLRQIDLFINHLKQNFPHQFSNLNIWDAIKGMLLRFAKELPYLFEGYSRLLSKISPKIVFLEDACYGMSNVPLIIAARKMNIPIGEYQHGLVSLLHPAYNYSDSIDDAYKYYLPSFYMSYGKYWIENSRIPIKVIEMGNPYLHENTDKNSNATKKEQLLYVSSAHYPEHYAEEVMLLHKELKECGCDVIFRIHPSETLRIQTVYKPILDEGIKIDMNPLYESLSETKYVFGEISTVLFEATMFNCVVFVLDTPYSAENMDMKMFNSIKSINEIMDKILNKKYNKRNSTDFWADNWRNNYRQFIDSII